MPRTERTPRCSGRPRPSHQPHPPKLSAPTTLSANPMRFRKIRRAAWGDTAQTCCNDQEF
eukprot:13482642-Alexandrium_andersonii.AAC.1